MLIFGAWGGLIADRVPKRRLLILTQGLHMVAAADSCSRLVAEGALVPWMVFALVFVRGCVNAVDYPTRQAFVIEMVGPDRVVNAVSLNSVLVHSAARHRPGPRRHPDRDRRARSPASPSTPRASRS